ncbi:MAG: hypothetical protein K0R24_1240 [Gammaproteobacteria bacterium]|jgi:hypothetical protein|nr:hypothetical protein [Gammaproteobacteria bacterium]
METIIYSYTRKDAIEDGVLADVSEFAKSVGFKVPVAITEAVWMDYIEWTEEDNIKQIYQNTTGRLWDVLSMLRFAIRSCPDNHTVYYKLYTIPRDGKSEKAKLIKLKATIGGGDEGEPVITIMLPNED